MLYTNFQSTYTPTPLHIIALFLSKLGIFYLLMGNRPADASGIDH